MPVIINRIFDSKFLNRNISYDMSRVKYVCTSGGKVSQKMIENLDATFKNSKIYLMYGLTEAFRSSYLIPEQLYVRPNSIGKAIPDVELYILNEKGDDCKPGEVGELVHRGGCISKGYWNDEINTKHRFRTIDRFPGEKVVFSGDYVKKDEDGFIYFISRKDNMLKNSGIRISPTEIEQTFEKNYKVISTVVFGIENIKVGHDIVLAYTSIDRKSIDIKELRKFAKNHLPFHMVPKYFFHFEEFPVTGNQGKIDRVTVVKSLEKKILQKQNDKKD
jgi:acyl-coenzyme A synthetase/AMP-(fatty) acid ligase